MKTFLGIDLGTSGVKALLLDERDEVVAQATAPLAISRPRPLWSEQNPDAWWASTQIALDTLAASPQARPADVAAIGLSGQMLGVALLDETDRPVRPALLWNDGRAAAECAELEETVPGFADLVGCRAMPGFPAPKLRWLSKHEPALLERARRFSLPKDVIRLHLTGEAATDDADGSATLLMNTRTVEWEPALLSAVGMSSGQLPRVMPSTAVTGTIRADWVDRWCFAPSTPVIAGAGDNMCGAIGAGVVRSGEACIGLGTSGVYVLANDHFVPAHGGGMHTHRHAVAGLFVQNACVLSAGAALNWIAGVIGAPDIPSLLADVTHAAIPIAETPVFTPYLAGERTPHDDPALTGTFSNLTLSTSRLHLAQSVLEGVALALGDCHRALASTGARVERVRIVGGGAQSRFWASLIASCTGLPLHVPRAGAYGPALGAARLARAGVGGPLIAADTIDEIIEPSPHYADQLAEKHSMFAGHGLLRQTSRPPVASA